MNDELDDLSQLQTMEIKSAKTDLSSLSLPPSITLSFSFFLSLHLSFTHLSLLLNQLCKSSSGDMKIKITPRIKTITLQMGFRKAN